MAIPEQSSLDALPLDLVRQIDAIARRAELVWQAGGTVEIENLLLEVPADGRGVLLEELLLIEREECRPSGKIAEEWSARFANYPDVIQRVLQAESEAAQTSECSDPQRQRFPSIPGYTIERQLGRGAMGVVYLARQERLQRKVAVKVVAAGIDGSQALSIIRSEAEIIARLQHPNIVQVYEVGDDHGEPFLAIEYVEGESLKERMLRECIPPRQAAELVETLARAIHHAHVHGVIHCDLKPANILLAQPSDPLLPTRTQRPIDSPKVAKISDFGLAKVLDALHDPTQSGVLLGTPKYMAPEQAEGRTREIGPATDVYAVGAIFFEMLTGRAPLEAESSIKLLKLITEQDVRFPDATRSQISPDLQAICLKCLEKSPARRYASAHELADDTRRFLDDFPVFARRPSAIGLFWKFVLRNRMLTLLMMMVLTTLIVGSIGIGFFAIREARARNQAEELARNERQARSHVESLRRQERRYIYWANLRLAQQAWQGGRLDHMRQLLQQAVPTQTNDPDLRGFEWHYLARLSQPRSMVFDAQSNEGRVTFSPDGQWLATAHGPNRITIWDTRTGEPKIDLSGHTAHVIDLAFSPDGKQLASGSRDNTARIWDCATGHEIRKFADHKFAVRSIAFSPDGQYLVSADEREQVMLWNLADGSQAWSFSRPELNVMDLAYSPDGQRLALGCGSGTVIFLDAKDGRELMTFQADHKHWLTGVAFSPCGLQLATCGGDKSAKVWNLADLAKPLELIGHRDWLTEVTFSSNGQSIATASRDGTLTIWDATTGRNRITLKGHTHWVMSVAFAADGDRVASSSLDGTVRIWNPSDDWVVRELAVAPHPVTCQAVAPQGDKLVVGHWDGRVSVRAVTTGEELGNVAAHPIFVSSVAVSPDSQTFATASHDGTIKVWDTDTCRERLVMQGHTAVVNCVTFSPTERRLASVGNDGMIRIWDQDTGGELHAIKCADSPMVAVAFSPDGRLLAACGMQNDTQIWDTSTWQQRQVLTGHTRYILCVTFSHDGRQVASCGSDQTIRIWDVSSGQQLQQLEGHTNVVTCVTFGHDGRRVLSCGYDGTIRLWETESGRELLMFNHHSDWANTVSFSPQENYIVSSSNDKTIKLIELQRP